MSDVVEVTTPVTTVQVTDDDQVTVVTDTRTDVVEVGYTQLLVFVGGDPGHYTHTQSAPAAAWIVEHHLGRHPTTDVILAGEVVDADVIHNDLDSLTVTFPSPTTGEAVCT